MKKSTVFFCLLIAFASVAIAEKPVQPLMHKLFKNMQELLPFMINADKFNDPKNNAKIEDHLKEMVTLIKQVKHTSNIKGPALKISQKALEAHFVQIDSIYRNGNKDFARWQLNSTLPLCMSCHTQEPSASRHWQLTNAVEQATNDFEKAEIYFMGRDFDKALVFYDRVIDKFPDNKISTLNLERSFERKVVIFSRVQRNFDAGIKNLEQSLKNKNMPKYIADNTKAWIASFRMQIRDGFPDPLKSDDKKIQEYVESELKRGLWDDMVKASNPRLVKNYTVSGILYEYLNTHPDTKLKQQIFYWLALCDRELRESLFFSLADLYLNECMQEDYTNPIAKKCYEEYKANMILSYSGSSGVHLPEDVREELKNLSIKIYGKEQPINERD